MTGNRHRHNGHGGPRGRSYELCIAVGAVASLALLIIVAFILFGRSQPASARRPQLQLADASARNTNNLVPVSDSVLQSDQRIAAAPRPVNTESGEIEVSAPRSAGDSSSGAEPAMPPQDEVAEPSQEESPSPRSLLRRARRQARSGQTQGVLDTSRQIASLLGDDDKRSRIETKVRDAEAAAGAGQIVDFDSLIQLIEQVIAPTSWSSVGGAGTIESFPGGVYIDTAGLVRPRPTHAASPDLSRIRHDVRTGNSPEHSHQDAGLRKVSLPRLETAVAQRLAQGQEPTDEMRYLAGLQEIRYVLVYPDANDIVLVGQAEDWLTDEWGRIVGRQSGRPMLQLVDLAVILRACFADSQNHARFGCGIYPRTQRLQQVQEFLARSAASGPIDPSQRERWLADLRDQLGEQDIEIFGIHPGSRVAHVMVEADYRMKLIGIGLEPAAVPGIPSYFDLIGQPDDARLNRPIDTLRWWFTLNYEAILTSDAYDAFELRGGRVQVLSENELLTATGQRVHTGQSDPINAQFAKNFTDQFPALSARDPNFADLAGIFDLAVLGGLLRMYELPQSTAWTMTTFLDPDELVVPLNPPPRSVETVINHRVYRGRDIHAVISGGVHVNPWKIVSAGRSRVDSDGALARLRSDTRSLQADTSPRWWWD